jgi:peptide/nickel transport system ATP-binding protein
MSIRGSLRVLCTAMREHQLGVAFGGTWSNDRLSVRRRGSMSGTAPILEIDGLSKSFGSRRGMNPFRRERTRVAAVDDVSLSVASGQTLAIVGESGSGKTTLARCVVRLLKPDAGIVRFEEVDLARAGRGDLQQIRTQLQMIYQDPYTSLNPQMTVGHAIGEPAKVFGASQGPLTNYVAELLDLVGLRPEIGRRYPRHLSGGQRQRVAIARALSVKPKLLIADEPVSALDVSIQAQIINLLMDLKASLGLTMVFIAHQLSVVQQVADTVAVMHLGRIVEVGPTKSVFDNPQHPYTAALLGSAPKILGLRSRKPRVADGHAVPLLPSGCRFAPRCQYKIDRCTTETPPLSDIAPMRTAACHVLPFARHAGRTT